MTVVSEPAAGDPAAFLRAHGVRTVRVEWCDLHGVARGKRVQADYFLDAGERGFPFSSAGIEMDLRGEIPWLQDQHLPWPNVYAVPDLGTLRLLPFEPRTAAVLADLVDDAGQPVAAAPRQVLRRVLEAAAERGYLCRIGPEIEFYLFRDARLSPLPPGKLAYRTRNGPQEQELIDSLTENLCSAGVACESLHAEDGPGQFEISLRHGPAMSVADALFVTRSMVKELAAGAGVVATFLPKPLPNESGSGFHIHQSLHDAASGAAVFCFDAQTGRACPALEHFLAGQLTYTPEVAALLLPTVNAYKRAAARQIRMNWGLDDRSVSFRVLLREDGFSLEHRVPGADANPYLFIATALATGLEGMDRGLAGGPVRPDSPPEVGAQPARSLPADLPAALDLLAASQIARRWLGDALIDRFVGLKRDEAARYARTLTDWERREYLEYL